MPKFDEHLLNNDKFQEFRQGGEESLVASLAKQYGYSYINLQGVSINPDALATVPEEEARRVGLVAFEKQNKKLSIAVRNPNNPEVKKLIDRLANDWQLNVFMCSVASLEHGFERYKDITETEAVKKGVLDIDPEEIAKLQLSLKRVEDVEAKILEIRSLNNARRVSATMEVLFAGAMSFKASDIHIEPEETEVRVRYRLDGVLHDIVNLERKVYERIISRIKLLAGLKLNIHDEAQDGRFTFEMADKVIEIRTSIIPGAAGESAVMRLLDPSVAGFNMEQLGLNDTLYQIMKREISRPNGLIITTGPTGSGKTTALYAFLRAAHTPEVKVITIEDPVEYKIEGLVQTQVGEDYTFASGLRSILRQDPDIIMVGEIRDREVAETAFHAAETGHLVFSTLHTNSAVGAFPRLMDLGVDSRIMGTSINIIIGQRLVRRLCDKCKTSHTITTPELEMINKVLSGHPKGITATTETLLYEATGCDQCGQTGFKGRQGVFEAVLMDNAVEEAVLRDPREHIILEAAREQGIPTMAEDGMEKVLAGITSLKELRRVVDLSDIRGAKPEENNNETPDDDFMSHIV